MDSSNAASLINIVGFAVGIALYGMLGVMAVLWGRGGVRNLLGATAVLGFLWNAGELAVIVLNDLGASVSPFLAAAAYSALGFLPSVVVHSALQTSRSRRWLVAFAYLLSSAAGSLHFYSAATSGTAPSALALQLLTIGAVVLISILLIVRYREAIEQKAIWGTALLVFAAGALHLSNPGDESSWPVELLAHQSSLPLALVILYQNYRFAFADIFLKRAVSVILLTAVAFAAYALFGAPFARLHSEHGSADVQATALMLGLWIATALAYPAIHRFAVALVDRAILKRPDYSELQSQIAKRIESASSETELLDRLSLLLGDALTAAQSGVHRVPEQAAESPVFVTAERDRASLHIPTHEEPFYTIELAVFEGGRRLLSDEAAMLESVALNAARKIDALRVARERFDHELRENEISKLATEAQLTALRAQINPHFLFNALTTIGYLIQTAPEKAFETLFDLTKLLRGLLGTSPEFTSLGAEISLIENYLGIERARFEEKLTVTIDIDENAEAILIPTLILQPLVENAIKHGIAENSKGGEITISGRVDEDDTLILSVFDSGADLYGEAGPVRDGVGLSLIRERLGRYYGSRGRLRVEVDPRTGSLSEIRLPIDRKFADLSTVRGDRMPGTAAERVTK